jgi:hypothetical protein
MLGPTPASEEPIQPVLAPQSEEVLSALQSLTAPPQGTCADVFEDRFEGHVSLGHVFSTYVHEAETTEVACTPSSGDGFRCRVSLVSGQGGEGAEWAVLVELTLNERREIDVASMNCDFAG